MAQGPTRGVPIDIDGTLANNSDLLVPSQKAVVTYVTSGLSSKQNALGFTPLNRAGDTMLGNLLLSSNPTLALQAATKDYVDTLINGIDWKQSAVAATVAALPAYTVSGSGTILTGNANGAIPSATTDGITLAATNRVLVKNETSTLTPNNGIYVVTQVGNGSTPFILTRADDANVSSELAEATISIYSGATLSNTQWHCNPASVPITLGTTYITFAQIGSGTYTATLPISITGNIISISQATTSTNGYLTSTDWNTFNNKQNALTNPVTGTGTLNELAYFTATGSTIGSLSTATYPSLTEISYVKGVTSAIQTQLNGKEPTIAAGTTLQYWRGDKSWQTLNTTAVVEATNLYYTDARARNSISLTTTGSSGASSYSLSTGVLNVPTYTLAGLGGVPTTRTLTINGTALDLSADRSWSVGTVTSVGLSLPAIFTITVSPVTTSGTLTATLASQTANTFFAAPNGTAGTPTFRAIAAADIPSLAYVTSVGGTGTVSGLTLTGTVTTFGNITLGGTLSVLPSNFAAQNPNVVLAGPATGVVAATPTFRALVAADIPPLSYLAAEADTLATVTGRGATTSTASTFSAGITVGGVGITYNGSTSGSTILKASAAAGSTTITMPATTGTMALLTDIPTVNNGTLTLSIGTAGATNTTVTVGTGTGFSANTATNATYSLSVGPAITALATLMATAGAGFIRRGATADTFSIDTNTYQTLSTNLTSLAGLTYVSGTYFVKMTGANTFALDSATYLTAAITSLGGQTGATQTFATGTSGTDFGISSATNTHTFNLPVASATNTGKLSNTDWSTFNNKQAAITLTTTGSSGSATFVSNTLNIPTYTLAGLGGLSNPMTTLGDIIYGGASGVATRLAGQATNGTYFLRENVTASAAVAPDWVASTGSGNVVLATAPSIAGGTHTALTTLSIRDTSAGFDVTIAATSSTILTAGRTLTLDMVNAARTIKLAGNIDIAGNLTTSGALSLSVPTQYGIIYASTTTAYSSTAAGTTTQVLHGNAAGAPTWSAVSLTADVSGTLPTGNGGTGLTTFTSGGAVYATSTSALTTGTLPIASGGTGVTSVTTTPTASAFAAWDANANLSADNMLLGQATITTAAGTTTLTVSSAYLQYFIGTSTQTVTLPVVTTLANGFSFKIINISTGVVTVNTSGTVAVQAMASNTQLTITCVDTAGGTGLASWKWQYETINNSTLPGGTSLNGTGYVKMNATTVSYVATIPLGDGGTNAALTATAGGIVYSTASALAISTAGSANQVLLSGGTGVPTWTNQSSLSAGSAVSVAGGGANQIVYQTNPGTTSFVASSTVNGAFLRSGGTGTAPAWSTLILPNAATTGDLVYASTTNTYGSLAIGTAGQILTVNSGATAPQWTTAPYRNKLYVNTATGTPSPAGSVTSVVSHTGVPFNQAMPANTLTAGKIARYVYTGRYTTGNNSTLTVAITAFGATFTISALTTTANAAAAGFQVILEILCLNATQAYYYMDLSTSPNTGGTTNRRIVTNTTTTVTTITTGSPQTNAVTTQMSVAGTVIFNMGTIEIY